MSVPTCGLCASAGTTVSLWCSQWSLDNYSLNARESSIRQWIQMVCNYLKLGRKNCTLGPNGFKSTNAEHEDVKFQYLVHYIDDKWKLFL